MSDTTRPSRAVPTTARRTPPTVIPAVPPVVVVPTMPAVSPPAPVTSQKVVYVQAPAPAPTQLKKQVEFVPVRRKPVRRMGMLAVMSAVTGIVAGVAAYRPEVFRLAPVIAAVGFAVGLFALFRSTFLSRTTFGPPLIGMTICFFAYVLAARNNARLQTDYNHLRGWTGQRLPVLALTRFESKLAVPPADVPVTPSPPPTAPAGTVARSTPTSPETGPKPSPGIANAGAPSAAPVTKKGDLSFLNQNSGGWIDMSKGKPASPTGASSAPSAAQVAPVSPAR